LNLPSAVTHRYDTEVKCIEYELPVIYCCIVKPVAHLLREFLYSVLPRSRFAESFQLLEVVAENRVNMLSLSHDALPLDVEHFRGHPVFRQEVEEQ
jgi:hypothetical protein